MKFLCSVFDRALYIQSHLSQSHLWEIIVESICDFKRAGNCFIIIRYRKKGKECDTILTEVKILIPFQVFFKSFSLSLKNFSR